MRRALGRFLVLAMALATWECSFGPTGGGFVRRNEGGAQAFLSVGRQRFHAELIEVRDSSIVVLRQGKLQLLPYSSIFEGQVREVNVAFDRRPPTREQREAMRLVSRFPQGMSPAVEQRLLASLGQTEILRP